MANDLKITQTTTSKSLHNDLGLKTFKKRQVHGLTQAQKVKRVKKSIMLSWIHAGDKIIFSEEKFFLVEDPLSHQNDRVGAVLLNNMAVNKLGFQRFQNVISIII